MESARHNFLTEATIRWKLSAAAVSIIKNLHGEPTDAATLAQLVKKCVIPLTQPRPISEAISTAGGVQFSSLTNHLTLKNPPPLQKYYENHHHNPHLNPRHHYSMDS